MIRDLARRYTWVIDAAKRTEDKRGSIPERDLRDSVGSLIYSGTSDIQRNIIARELGL